MSNNKKTVAKHFRVQAAKVQKYDEFQRALDERGLKGLTWPMLHNAYSNELSPFGEKIMRRIYAREDD